MDDPRWLRLITIGLVLAAMAVGYFLIAGKFLSNKSQKVQTQVTKTVQPSVLGQQTPSASPMQSAYTRIVNRTQGGVQTLPKTGFPLVLVGIFSASAMVAGLGLRKFPN